MRRQARHDTGSHEVMRSPKEYFQKISPSCLTSDNIHSAQHGVAHQVNAERLQRSHSLKHLCVFQIPNYWVRLTQTIHLRACEELPSPKSTEQNRISFWPRSSPWESFHFPLMDVHFQTQRRTAYTQAVRRRKLFVYWPSPIRASI